MATRKHVLLVLPALLAAMGTAAHPAYASDQPALLSDLAVTPGSGSIEPAAAPLALAGEGALEPEAKAGDPVQPAADETLRRTIFDILADARSRIGYLPNPAATPAIVSGESFGVEPPAAAGAGGAPEPIAAEAPRRTIFDILAEAHGNPRFLAKDAPLGADGVADEPPAEPLAATPQPPKAEGHVDDAPQPIAAETPRRTIFDILADARGNPRFLGQAASPADSVGDESPAQPQPSLVVQASRSPATKAQVGHARQAIVAKAGPPAVAENPAGSRLQTEPHATRSGSTPDHRIGAEDILAKPIQGYEPSRATPTAARVDEAMAPPPVAHRGEPDATTGKAPLPQPTTPPPLARSEQENRDPGATPAPAKPRPALMVAADIDPEKLDKLRGGFEGPGGLRVNFGIERVVLINGALQSSTRLNVADLSRAVGGGSNPADALPAAATVSVVQNGLNNTVSTMQPGAAMTTIVQNSLDNQKLQTITTLNVVVNSAELMRGMRMQQSLQDSLNRAALAR